MSLGVIGMCFFVADFSELCRRIDGRPPRSRPVQLRCSKPSSLARQDHVENASAGQSGQCALFASGRCFESLPSSADRRRWSARSRDSR
jgi:hypothetical protein